jgi:cystathionine beta-lyase/cystathionine gamma-synthase
MRFDTKLVHLGQVADGSGDVVPPIHVAATYDRGVQDPVRYFYARGENPTRERLEQCLASLEDARFATVFSSGQAAAMTVLGSLSPGQRVLSSDDIYGGTYALFSLLGRWGIGVDYVNLSDPEVVARTFDEKRLAGVAMVWVETPSNPLLEISDLAEVCRLAHRLGVLVVVDNTLASPVLQQPLRWADVSLYSTTKFIAGHLDVLGGALVYNDEDLRERFLSYRTIAGNVPGGLDCFLVHRGLKTLSLRVARQVETAREIAVTLRSSPAVGKVHYPGLAEHPHREVALRQMSGPGSIISFEYLGDPEKLMDRVRLFASAVSLGGVRSLIECPASMTHSAGSRTT